MVKVHEDTIIIFTFLYRLILLRSYLILLPFVQGMHIVSSCVEQSVDYLITYL